MIEPYSKSLIAITPHAFKATAELLGQAMGHSGNEFRVAIPDESNPTHWALHTWITPGTADVWLGNTYPQGALDAGYTEEQIDTIRGQLIISVIDDPAQTQALVHFQQVLGENGLSLSEPDV